MLHQTLSWPSTMRRLGNPRAQCVPARACELRAKIKETSVTTAREIQSILFAVKPYFGKQ